MTNLFDALDAIEAAEHEPDMQPLLMRSAQVRSAHKLVRERLAARTLDLRGLYVQAVLDPDVGTMLVRRALSAIPRMTASKATEVMQLARLPQTRRIGWVAANPSAAQRLDDALVQVLHPPRTKKVPHPNWPWMGGVGG